MTTTLTPRGRKSKFRLNYETTFATNPGTGSVEINTYASEIKPGVTLPDDDVLGAGFANSRPAGPPLPDVTATATLPLDLNQIGHALKLALGAATVTGNATKTHTFTSGAEQLPTVSLERENINGSSYEGAVGGAVKSVKISFGPKAGYNQVEVQFAAAKYVEPYGSTAMAAPVVETLVARVPNNVGNLSIDGSLASAVMSGDVTITNDLVTDHNVNDAGAVSEIAIDGGCSAVMTATARYKDDVLRGLGALGGNPLPGVHDVSIGFPLGANLTLTVRMQQTRFETPSVAFSNGKSTTVSLSGRGEVGASTPMVSAVLVNAHAAY
jgi:Phage tail tube protein